MKKTIKFTSLLILSLLLSTYSCSDDDRVVITLENLEVTIDENPTTNQVIGSIESDSNSSLTFSIDAQTPSGVLSIDANTGELTVANEALYDFETNPIITATVSAVEASNTATVTINLNDVNELSTQDFSASIDENPANGDVIGTVQAMGDATVTFSIATQTPADALSIDATSGELTVADALLFNFEANPTITATITVDNSGNMSDLTAVITLNNVGELSPQDFNGTIDENPANGDIIGTVVAPGFGATTFSLTTQTPASALNINSITGELSVADASLFDFEANPTITADVLVENSGETATLSATITLNDIVVTISTFDESIDENPTNGQVLGTVMSDATGNPNYSIVSQTPAGAVSIDPNTGVVTVADASLFDHETNQQVDAIITADEAIDTDDFEIQIDNVNEVGDFNYGGVIFWVNAANDEGYVVSMNNLSTSAPYGCQGTFAGATGTAIGSGEANTAAIMTACSTLGTAAELAFNLNTNSYDDWFLPSQDEFNEIMNNIATLNINLVANGGSSISGSYWTSTETSASFARYYASAGGFFPESQKNAPSRVRAVRAWTDF